MDDYLLSIIIPTFNSGEYISWCLDSIYAQEFKKIEIIVVDNGSTDATVSMIKKDYPSVALIQNNKNRGAAAARNQGIKAAKGTFLMLLDCDVVLRRNFFLKLDSFLHALSDEVAALAPKIIDRKTSKVFSCGLLVTGLYRAHDAGSGLSPNECQQGFLVDGPNTACAIFRKEYLEKIKEEDVFDEDFFFLFEDVDVALRLKKMQLECKFVPELVCVHEGRSAPFSRQKRRYLCLRNRLYMIIKYNRGRRLFLFLCKSFFYDSARLIYHFLTNWHSLRLFHDIPKKFSRCRK